MEKDFQSTTTAVNTQGSCPVLGGSSLPSPSQMPPSLISNNLPAAPSQLAKSPSSTETTTEPRKVSYSSHPSEHTTSKPVDSPPPSKGSKPLTPAVSSKPESKTVSAKSSSPTPNKTPLATSPNCSTPQIPQMSSFSKLTSASSTSASLAHNTPTNSPPSSSNTTPTVAPATSSTNPMKRTFASMAKRVIIQERLRKAEEDANDEEDDEEPEEDLSVDQMEEKAKAGDARAQTRCKFEKRCWWKKKGGLRWKMSPDFAFKTLQL